MPLLARKPHFCPRGENITKEKERVPQGQERSPWQKDSQFRSSSSGETVAALGVIKQCGTNIQKTNRGMGLSIR